MTAVSLHSLHTEKEGFGERVCPHDTQEPPGHWSLWGQGAPNNCASIAVTVCEM